MLRPSGPVAFFVVMPDYEAHAGTPVEVRDARGDHDLVFGADEEGEILRTLAPGISSAGGGAGPIRSTYGQFVSIMYEALITVPETNGPTAEKRIGSHRVNGVALRRWWTTTLAILNRLSPTESNLIKQSKERGELIERLAGMRALATTHERASLCLFNVDMEPISCLTDGTLSTSYSTMPLWFRQASFQRGDLADEETGSLHVAAVIELYSVGRLNFHNGLTANSHARAFAVAASAAAERSAMAMGHTTASWGLVPDNVKAQKVLMYLASCRWPSKLDHWRASPVHLSSDMSDMFIYADCGGVGKVAEKELLSTPMRTRAVLAQIPLIKDVVMHPPGASDLHAALRRLVQASTGLAQAEVFVTLDAVLHAAEMLKSAAAHCSGIKFLHKLFNDRVAGAVRLLEVRRGALSSSGSSGDHALGYCPQGEAKGGTSGGYDKLRLHDCKNSIEYVSTKRQVQSASAAKLMDKAILACSRGADGLPAAPGMPAPRLAPLKVYHDMLYGTKDVYLIDKELDSDIAELRRALPNFWGRRAAKALGVQLQFDIPLTGLAEAMANTSTWSTSPPDFYVLALVPIRVAAGANESELYKSHMHKIGDPPYANMAVVNAITMLVISLLSDLGVAHTSVDDVSAPGADIASPDDLFKLVVDLHGKVGSLPTTGAKMDKLISGFLGDFGTRRSEIRKSADAERRLNTRLIEPGSERLTEFFKGTTMLEKGQQTRANLEAMGYTLQEASTTPTPAPSVSAGRKRPAPEEQPDWSHEPAQPEEQPDDYGWYWPPEVTAKLAGGGDILHVEGGDRGPAGCFYRIIGAGGVADTLAETEGMEDVCPVWLVCKILGVPPPGLHNACGNRSHKSGSAEHPEWNRRDLQYWMPNFKTSDYRVHFDGYTWTAHAAGKGYSAGKGKQGKGKDKGKGKGKGKNGKGGKSGKSGI